MGHSAVEAYSGDTLILVGELPEDLGGEPMEPGWSLERRRGGGGAAITLTTTAAAGSGGDNGVDPPPRGGGGRACATGGPLLHEALRRDWRLERRMAVPQWPMARAHTSPLPARLSSPVQLQSSSPLSCSALRRRET